MEMLIATFVKKLDPAVGAKLENLHRVLLEYWRPSLTF